MLPAALLSVVSALWLTTSPAPHSVDGETTSPSLAGTRSRRVDAPLPGRLALPRPSDPVARTELAPSSVVEVVQLAGTQLAEARGRVARGFDAVGLGFAVPDVSALIGFGVSRVARPARREGWLGGLDGANGLSNGAVFDMGVVSLVDAAMKAPTARGASTFHVVPDVSVGLDGAASAGVAGVF